MTTEDIIAAQIEVARLTHELDITNADHIALWLEANMANSSLAWMACRIVEAHKAQLTEAKADMVPRDVALSWQAKAENNQQEREDLLAAISDMMSQHVDNWPAPKKLSTAIALIGKTLDAMVPIETAKADAERLVFQIGDRVRVVPETSGEEWRGERDHYITGINWHPKHGVTYTTSECWPPRCEGNFVQGLTDEWRPEHLALASYREKHNASQ